MAQDSNTVLLPNDHRWLVTIQIPGTSTPRVVEITAPNEKAVAAVLARSNLKYLTPPIDLGPAPISDASLVAQGDHLANLITMSNSQTFQVTQELRQLRTQGFLGSPVITIAMGAFMGVIVTVILGALLLFGLTSIGLSAR